MRASGLPAQAPIERRPPASIINPDLSDQDVPNQDLPMQTLHVETRLVDLALNVVDEAGAPVSGLNKEDFEVLEDGKLQKIAVFERQSTTPLSLVLAIDGSESTLRDERLEKDAAKKFVHALLRDQDELDVMEFADNVHEIVSFTNDKRRIDSGLNELLRGDATALYNAVYLASQRLAETSGANGRRRVLVLITDGGDTVKGVQYGQALEQAQRAAVMVYSLIIVPIAADAGRNTGGEHALIQFGMDTGGKYYYVEEAKDLAPAFAKVSDDLRTQYRIGYYAPQRGRDTSFRSITIRLKDPALAAKYSLRYRTGYYANGK
jgi:Ca-activated chloride channel family protein